MHSLDSYNLQITAVDKHKQLLISWLLAIASLLCENNKTHVLKLEITNGSWILSSSKLFQGEGYFNKLKLYAYDFFSNLNLMLVNFTKRKLHSSRTKSRCLSLLSDIDRVQVSSFLGALNWHWIEYCSMIVRCFRHSLICQINPGQTRLYRTISFRQMKDRCPLERTDEPQGNVSCHILCKP